MEPAEPADEWLEGREDLLVCRVRGLKYDEPPWGTKLVYEYCDCCGVQFSYGDGTLQTIRPWRNDWLAGGAKWFKPERRPAAWDRDLQLAQVPDDPH